MPGAELVAALGAPILEALLGLPAQVRRQLAQQLLQDTEATAADTARLLAEAEAREAGWTRTAPTPAPPALPAAAAPAPPAPSPDASPAAAAPPVGAPR